MRNNLIGLIVALLYIDAMYREFDFVVNTMMFKYVIMINKNASYPQLARIFTCI